MQFSQILTNIW